jgi:hypothetical protein
LFDPADQTLHLANQVGLSDEGCRQLRRVGHGGSGTWGAPLESLLERRIRVLGRAAGHDLPPLVEPPASITAVACLPVHRDEQPQASVILIAVVPGALEAEALQHLAPSLETVGQIVGNMERSEAPSAPVSSTTAGSPLEKIGLAARGARELLDWLRRPSTETTPARPAGGTEPGPEDQLTTVLAEGDTLLESREAAARTHETEVAHLTARLAETEGRWAHEHSLRIEQQRRVERWRTQSEAERDETVHRALQLLEAAEHLRATAVAETEALRNALADAERVNLAGRTETRRARAQAEAAVAAATTARAEQEQVARALEETRASAAAAARRSGELEAQVAALAGGEAAAQARAADVDARWQSKLAEVERALESERQHVTASEQARTELAARWEEAVAREQQQHAEHEARLERSAAEGQAMLGKAREVAQQAEAARATAMAELEALRTAFGQAQQQLLEAEERAAPTQEARLRYAAEVHQQLEDARQAAVAEVETVRGALAAAQAETVAARCDAQQARQETAAVAAEHRAVFAHAERLAHTLEDARAALAEARGRAPQLEEELRRLREESAVKEAAGQGRAAEAEARWLARVSELERVGVAERERAADLERDLARQTQALTEARAGEERAREMLAVIMEDREGTLARATELAQTAKDARAAAAAEAEALRAALTATETRLFQAEEAARHARADAEAEEDRSRPSLAEREPPSRAVHEPRARTTDVEDASGAHVQPEPPPMGAGAATGPPPASSAERSLLVVLDAGKAFTASSPPDARVEILVPGPDLSERLAPLAPTRVLVNLAAPGGLEAIATLRHAGFPARLWGCLAPPGRETVLLLGMVETLGRDLDPEQVLARLKGYARRGTRILSIGTSSGSLLSLRQALTRAGMSVAIGWDAKQATDLLAMVRPEVVIVDLALPRGGGPGIVIELAALEPRPLIMLVPSAAGDASTAFAAALAEREPSRSAALQPLRALETLLRWSEAAPVVPARR